MTLGIGKILRRSCSVVVHGPRDVLLITSTGISSRYRATAERLVWALSCQVRMPLTALLSCNQRDHFADSYTIDEVYGTRILLPLVDV